jgi:hypothetical protein
VQKDEKELSENEREMDTSIKWSPNPDAMILTGEVSNHLYLNGGGLFRGGGARVIEWFHCLLCEAMWRSR